MNQTEIKTWKQKDGSEKEFSAMSEHELMETWAKAVQLQQKKNDKAIEMHAKAEKLMKQAEYLLNTAGRFHEAKKEVEKELHSRGSFVDYGKALKFDFLDSKGIQWILKLIPQSNKKQQNNQSIKY